MSKMLRNFGVAVCGLFLTTAVFAADEAAMPADHNMGAAQQQAAPMVEKTATKHKNMHHKKAGKHHGKKRHCKKQHCKKRHGMKHHDSKMMKKQGQL